MRGVPDDKAVRLSREPGSEPTVIQSPVVPRSRRGLLAVELELRQADAENARLRATVARQAAALDAVRVLAEPFRRRYGQSDVGDLARAILAALAAAPSPEPQPLDERESQEAEYTRLRAAADRLADAMPERSNECVRGYYPGKDDPEDEAAAGCLTHNRPWHDCQPPVGSVVERLGVAWCRSKASGWYALNVEGNPLSEWPLLSDARVIFQPRQ